MFVCLSSGHQQSGRYKAGLVRLLSFAGASGNIEGSAETLIKIYEDNRQFGTDDAKRSCFNYLTYESGVDDQSAHLVHRENPRPMDVVMNGWLRLP